MPLSRRRFLGGCLVTTSTAASQALAYGEEISPKEKFKILSLDGGGVRGYLSAGILANIEAYLDSKTGRQLPLGQRFDLIAGTSTGGIIALGLAIGRTAAEIRDFTRSLFQRSFQIMRRPSLCFGSLNRNIATLL